MSPYDSSLGLFIDELAEALAVAQLVGGSGAAADECLQELAGGGVGFLDLGGDGAELAEDRVAFATVDGTTGHALRADGGRGAIVGEVLPHARHRRCSAGRQSVGFCRGAQPGALP